MLPRSAAGMTGWDDLFHQVKPHFWLGQRPGPRLGPGACLAVCPARVMAGMWQSARPGRVQHTLSATARENTDAPHYGHAGHHAARDPQAG